MGTDVERDGRKSLKDNLNTWGPGRISFRMHFITDENNETAPRREEKRYEQGKKEVLFGNYQDECGTDQGEPAWWLVRTKKSSKGKAEGAEVEGK